MMITSKNLFEFRKPTISNESGSDREQAYVRALGKVRSPIFKKFLESLNGKTPDQDYDRFLGLIDLISNNLIPEVKKPFELVLAPDYLKGVDESKIRDKVYDDLFGMYEKIKAKRAK